MAKYSDLLSSAGFDAATAQVAMGGTAPARKTDAPAEPAKPAPSYSYMADNVARGLTDTTRAAIDRQEINLEMRRQSIEQGEEGAFNALAQGNVTSQEFQRRMGLIDFARTNESVGLPAQEAALRQTQTTAARAVNAVAEVSTQMGVMQPQVDIPLSQGVFAEGGRVQEEGKPERGVVSFSGQTISTLSDRGLRFAAAHEVAHTADPQLAVGHASEFRADAAAIRTTCDVPGAVEALTALSRLGQIPLTASATHPSLEARISNMQEVYDSECRKPADTPAPQSSGRSGQDR